MRWSGILLLICLCLPLVGIVTVFKYQKKQIRREIKHKIIEGLDRSELVEIKLHKSDFHLLRWEHSKEFEFNGEMYDVVFIEESADSITYLCWWDYEETALNKSLKSHLAQALDANPLRQQSKGQLIILLKTPIVILEGFYLLNPERESLSIRADCLIEFSSLKTAPDSPPPQASTGSA